MCYFYRLTSSVILMKGFLMLLLLVISLFFVKSVIEEYLEGTKHFSTAHRPLTKEDLPTISICILSSRKLVYNTDFSIHTVDNHHTLRNENETIKFLKEGENNFIYYRHQEIFLRQLTTLDAPSSFKSCVSLDVKVKIWFVLGFLSVTISEKFTRQEEIYHVYLYLTSYQNSYGAANKRFYDGKVQHFELQKGGYDNIDITKVAQYQFIQATCKPTSFYQCFGLKLNRSEKCQENGLQCAPCSMPTETIYQDYPICQNKKVWEECENDWQDLMNQNTCGDLKPCTVQEYTARRNFLWSVTQENRLSVQKSLKQFLSDHVVDELLKGQSNKYTLYIAFYAPSSLRGKYTTEVQKEVYKEYWTWTGISLVGNVGGQLGLFVGFSFTGLMAWMLDLAPKLHNAIKRRVSQNPESVSM